MDIKNKVAIVTGASSGIGLATAKYLSSKGAKVVLASRSADILKKLEKELPDSLAVTTDMTKQDEIKNLINSAMKKYGRVDILVNNAGCGMFDSVETLNIDQYSQLMELNVYAVLRAMQAVIPHMRKQGKGLIVNISSALSKAYVPGFAAYSATKHTINVFSLIARQELEKDGIIVSLVYPKMTQTNFMKNCIGPKPDWAFETMGGDKPEKVAEKIAELIKSERTEIDV